MVLFFQFNLKMAVQAACMKRKFVKRTTFLRRINFIFMLFPEELASLVHAVNPFSSDLEG